MRRPGFTYPFRRGIPLPALLLVVVLVTVMVAAVARR